MARLTYKNVTGEWGLIGKAWPEIPAAEQLVTYGALFKLMQYEETGLEPEQIIEMDELYAEKCKEVAELKSRDTAKKPIDKCMFMECPNCGSVDIANENYCDRCGQKLDWSE